MSFGSRRILVALAIALLGLAMVVYRATDSRFVCLSWNGVAWIKYNNETVYSCHDSSRLLLPRVSRELKEFADRINRLARLNWLSQSPKHALTLTITRDVDQFDGGTAIDESLARIPGQLERAAVLGWIEHNWPEQEDLSQEVIADLLVWTVLGNAYIWDPNSGQKIETSQRMKYHLMPRNFIRYCQSPFRSLEHFASCESEDESVFQTGFGYRPLVSYIIWKTVGDLPMSEQIAFVKRLLNSHTYFEVGEFGGGREEVKTLASRYLKLWLGGFDERASHFARALKETAVSFNPEFDLAVQTEGEGSTDVEKSLRNYLRWNHKNALLVRDGVPTILPDNLPVELPPEEIKVRHSLLVACHWPDPKDILNFTALSFHAVQSCHGEQLSILNEVFSN